jgi:hypothetical protein
MRSLIVLVLLAVAQSASAQVPSWGVDAFQAPADPHWRQIAVGDVNAAFELLSKNHPGAAVELHDLDFQHRLTTARVSALNRAKRVNSYQGYLATLAAFANGMGDKHIWSRPTFVVNLPQWAQIIVSKRGDRWVVTDTEDSYKHLLGASLLACDQQAVETLARQNLGAFRANWEIGAQQTQSAPWLFVDEGNPFVSRPKSCTFDVAGSHLTVGLTWTRIKRENLLPRLKTAIGGGAAGFGIRSVGSGFWIALQDLSDSQTDQVVKAVEDQKTALRAAAFVVLDLRGNGGGSSEVGRELARSLMGSEAVDARLGSEAESQCGGPDGAWRASSGNISNLEYLLRTVALQGGPEARQALEQQLRETRAAHQGGLAFSGSIMCPASPPIQARENKPASQMRGRLILLTDNLCFSSCLSVTDDLRALGAFHVGQTTDAATHFVEVREQYLPSGYSLFSTLQSVDPSSPAKVGPFEPALPYPGDIADTAALESWVISTAFPAATRQ